MRICKGLLTHVKPDKQALGIFLSLKGKTREVVVEIAIDELNYKDDVDNYLLN